MMHKKARKQFAEDKQTRTFLEPCSVSDETKINLFGSDGVKHVWAATRCGVQRQMCLAYSPAWWWECHGRGLHECCRHWYFDILKQSMIPSLRDWTTKKQYSNMITTAALLKKLRVKVMDWPSMSQDLNPIEHVWGILKLKVEERKVSNIHQLHDVIIEEWKRTPVATCEALVNSMPKKVKALLGNNGGHTKY